MSQSALTANPTATRKRWLRWGALGAVVLVPLAFAGLFVGAISGSDNALENIPAAIVNEDTLVYQTQADGTETPVFAGRLLVTELTGGDEAGFDWRITNAEDAAEALENGEVYAVLTVPSNFSESIMSISGDSPEQADISIDTDDSHSYLTGSVAQAVGSSMVATFGNVITAQYIGGIYSSLGEVGTAFQTASDGASDLADGTDGLADGLTELADGTNSAASGAQQLSTGVDKYTGGVDGISGGLATLAKKTKNLGDLSSGITAYTGGVSGLAAAIAEATADLQANPNDPVALGTLAYLSGELTTAAAGGTELAAGASGLPSLSKGISQLSSGATQLSAGSSGLRSGVSGIASGLTQLGDGAEASADGAAKLADGTRELADGLSTGADSIPALDEDAAAASAEVAADPVSLTVNTENPVTDVGQGIATLFVPLGLWIGALAIFLVLRPVTRRALTSTANSGRLVFSSLARAGIVSVAQALLLVLLLHLALKVDWALLPATLGFSVLMAVAFTAFHYLLTIGFGRAGLVVSLFLLAIQITSTGSIYPIEVLAAPFQAISPFLPLTHGVAGMQVIMSGGNVASIGVAIAALVLFGIGSVLIALLAINRTRRAVALGLVPSAA
jgi:putative membrane protein